MDLGDLATAEPAVPDLDDVLLDLVHVGVCVVREQRFVYVNRQLADMLGRDAAQMVGGMEARAIVHPDDRALVADNVRRRETGHAVPPYDIRLVDADGRVLHVRVCGRIIRFQGREANLVTMTEISELKEALHAADWRARMLALTEELCGGASLAIDLHQDRITTSAGWSALLGEPCPTTGVRRRAVLSRIPRSERGGVIAAWRNAPPGRPFEMQHRLLCADGRLRIVHQRGFIEPDADGGRPRGIAILRDITEQTDARRQLEEMPNLDPLTGLPNRSGLIERMAQHAHAACDPDAPAILLVVEVPQLAQVKQGLGFEAGDELAAVIAYRLSAVLPQGDVLARLGGGEFAVLAATAPGADLGAALSMRTRAVAAALEDPVSLADANVFATHAIGAARSPEDGPLNASLLSAALLALKAAVDAGPGALRLASSNGTDRAQRQIALEWALRRAVEDGELRLHYQPQVDLRSGEVRAVEALLRWHSPTLGEVGPAEFVPVAEQSGQIVALGDWVLAEACAQAARWKREGLGALRVHVNVSAAQLAAEDFAGRVQGVLLAAGADAAQLGIEITESALARDTAKAARELAALRGIGVEIALDDFGTGYSNLSTLRALPIDVIKIDRSYVHDVLAAPSDVSVTRAVITMAHSLQMRVLAEGVETESQLALLIANRCDAIQGFYFSEAVGAEAVAALVREGRRLPERLCCRTTKKRTLLLVDDEDNILASLRRLLRRSDYHIITATSAAEGLERLAQTEVDVIVSDQRMPGMTGVEFLRRAKALYPHTVRIVLSGYTELQSITAAINEGAIYKFLTKPWEDDLLRANIEEAFRQKELADENRRLDQEVRSANVELAELNERLQGALARQTEQMSLAEDRGRSALEVLYNVPMPLIGLDAEGLVAFANQDAERLLPGVLGWLGAYADECLPPDFQRVLTLEDGQAIDIVIDGFACRCSCRLIDDGGRRGRLVAIVPQR